MAHLSISLLGTFQVALDGCPINDSRTDKALAFLPYLGVPLLLIEREGLQFNAPAMYSRQP
jgi:hypothetical protein